jgi:hypothetical protein
VREFCYFGNGYGLGLPATTCHPRTRECEPGVLRRTQALSIL